MKPDTICFLIRTPLTERDYKRFGVELLQKRGFKILFLDFTQMLNSHYSAEYQSSDLIDYEGVIRLEGETNFNEFLRANRNAFVIDLYRGSRDTLFIYRAFKKFNVRYGIFCTNNVPISGDRIKNGSIFKKTIKLFKSAHKIKGIIMLGNKITNSIADKWASFVFALPYNISGLQSPDFLLVGGHRFAAGQIRAGSQTKIIWAHTLDYDLFLAKKNKSLNDCNGNYAVFLDEYLPYHPDYLLMGNNIAIDADKYYESLNRFFDWFENKYQTPVIIAADPRSRYDQKTDCFGGRRIELGKTIELVAGANCVFTHCSTSINFAVIYRKPLIFLTTNLLEECHFYQYHTTYFSAQFNKKPINVDLITSEYNLQEAFAINENLYGEYYSNYIKIPGTPEKPFWGIVADALLGVD